MPNPSVPKEDAEELRNEESHEEDDDEEEEEEPRLKYTRLTRPLGGVYRNGDAVSASLVFGERMILGTHNGNIHVLTLPSLTPLRVYHAHSASVTSISISPPPSPPLSLSSRRHTPPSLLDKQIHIATSSIDGLICVVPLLPFNPSPHPNSNPTTTPYARSEIVSKNLKRPILSAALSPNFRTDRTFLSGGLAGNLVLSVAPPPGGAGSWMGLGGGGGKDTVLHSGEGTISVIAWSKESPRFVAWTNEHGIKIMRSHIVPPTIRKEGSLVPEETTLGNPGIGAWIPGLGVGGKPAGEIAWKRISAIERPESIPEELASVNRPRLEWIDRRTISDDDKEEAVVFSEMAVAGSAGTGTEWGDKEKLIVGWGGTVWVIDVLAGDGGEGQNIAGWAEIVHILQTDCIVSGLTLYSPSLLLVLAYIAGTGPAKSPEPQSNSGKLKGVEGKPVPTRRGRTNALTPELRFIDLNTSEELSADELMMSRFEGLSVGDYHLGVLPATPPSNITRPPTAESGSLGSNLWAAGVNATQIFSSAASVRSLGSSSRKESFGSSSKGGTWAASLRGVPRIATKHEVEDEGWSEEMIGRKIYITSPYDVVFATERSQKDNLAWMLEKEKYQEAWELVDKNPEIIVDAAALNEYDEVERKVVGEGEEDSVGYESDSTVSRKVVQKHYTAAEKEKRRIGELWLQKEINANHWTFAGVVCGRVLGTSTRWEHWVWVFEAAGKIEDITPYIPTTQLSPPLPSVIYEIVLAHYLNHDRQRFKDLLLKVWKPERTRTLYDARTIIDAVERKLMNKEDGIEEGGDDWRGLKEGLARLYMVVGEPRNALRCYVLLKDADEAFKLIKEYRLVDAVRGDIASLILLRVSDQQLRNSGIKELENATSEAIGLLIEEAGRGIVGPAAVVEQLENDNVRAGHLFLFFYLRRLWLRDGSAEAKGVGTSGALAELGDRMVELFAEYDRELLMDFLRDSHTYSLELASQICESRNYIPELVHLLSKTGQTKRALFLIIDRLDDVEQSISFAKAQDDKELWNDLLDYSMDKPKFIRGLLENVGTSIDPIVLVRRIKEGLEVQGLKSALGKILKEYGVQWSICEGVAKVLRSEVARGMDDLRGGRRRGVKFSVGPERRIEDALGGNFEKREDGAKGLRVFKPGACGGCTNSFEENEKQTLIAFACGHVFHLKCLLPPNSEAEEAEEIHNVLLRSTPLSNTDVVEDHETMGYGRSVGPKVTHAALIKDKVSKGCITCSNKVDKLF